ncbi:MAG: acetyltransferase, partial [Verrucomicrobiota bacterium]
MDLSSERRSLPRDGRYKAANDVLAMELRIDISGSGIVSADLFAASAFHREYVAGIRSRPGATLSRSSNPLDIVGEDIDGRRTRGRLSIRESREGEIAVDLQLNESLRAMPAGHPFMLVGRFEHHRLREIGIEMEVERGADIGVSWPQDGENHTVFSCLERAGFDVYHVGHRDEIPHSIKWDNAQLHGLMTDYADEPLDRKDWHLQLLMLKESAEDGLLGIMFDTAEWDGNNLPRQGAAVFQTPIKNNYPDDWPRKLIQTTTHELGHVFNLAHRFERPIGRADSTSFMNYASRYLGGHNESRFWQDFRFTFDEDELAFLRHGPLDKVIPGGDEFHTAEYWTTSDGGYVPYRFEIPDPRFELSIEAPGLGNVFPFAAPVFLTVRLTNRTGRPMELPGFLLDVKAGFLSFEIRRVTPFGGGGEAHTFQPIAHRCFDLASPVMDRVEPDQHLTRNVNLTFGSAGWTFAESGTYEITAVFKFGNDRRLVQTVVSDPIRIRVAYPNSPEDEEIGLQLFRPDIGHYLALGGSDALPDAE